MPAPLESLDILERLIAFETVSRTPNRALIDYVQALLEAAGASCVRVGSADGASANLYARVGPAGADAGAGGGGGVLLSGHSDVVPAAGQDWTPFRPGEGGDDETRRDRMDALHIRAHRAIDRLAVADVGEIDDQPAEMLHPRAAFLQQQADVAHRLMRLRGRIADADRGGAWQRSLSSFCSG
eukprot:g16130.t1